MIWQMDGTNFVAALNLSVNLNLVNWQNQGTGDFNGDGHPDIVWRNESTGANQIGLLSGTNVIGTNVYSAVTDVNWRINAAGSYHANTNSDLIWRNLQYDGAARGEYCDLAHGWDESPYWCLSSLAH